MSVAAVARQPAGPEQGPLASLPPTRLALLEQQISRGVSPSLPTGHDPVLSRLIAEGIAAFVTCGGSPARAAHSVCDLFREVGEQQARLGRDPREVARAFDQARVATQRGMRTALGGVIRGGIDVRLREDVAAYLTLLQQHCVGALVRTRRLLSMSRAQAHGELRAAVFGSGRGRDDLDLLVEVAGLSPSGVLRPVVAVRGPLPGPLHERIILAGLDPHEGLLDGAEVPDVLGAALAAQVVLGPTVPVSRAPEAIEMTREAAMLLRTGAVRDARTVVPCADLVGALLVRGNPLLTDMLVDKHLGELAAAGPRRRLQLGSFLLAWLEHGRPVSQLARELSIPPQTAHGRMQALRRIFGDALDDPDARLELTLALRAVLPAWGEGG